MDLNGNVTADTPTERKTTIWILLPKTGSRFGKAKYACVPGFNCYSCPGAVGACPLGAIQNALASSGHQAGWDNWLVPFALDDDNDTIFEVVNGSTTLPQTIVLNRKGEVVYNMVGSVTPDMLEALYRQADAGVTAALR